VVEVPSIYLTCAPGLSSMLRDEAAELGLRDLVVSDLGVRAKFSWNAMFRANLGSHLATRVEFCLPGFQARRFDELRKKVSRAPWSRFVRARQNVCIRVKSQKSRLMHSGAVIQRVHEAMQDAIEGRLTLVKPADEADALRVNVTLRANACSVRIDTSGDPLHRRGYRLAVGKAPLREDLAAALIRFSGWDRESSLVDPLMGSGVIPIEAALMAKGLPPGAGRSFAFQDFPSFEASSFEATLKSLNETGKRNPDFLIHGSDRDAGSVEAARANAERAGVLDIVRFEQASLSGAPALASLDEDAPGAVVSNPPYGKRVKGGASLPALYKRLGSFLADRPDSELGLVTADREFAYGMGIRLAPAIATLHGGSRVWFFRREAELPMPG